MRLGKYEHPLRLFFLGTVLALTYLAILIPAGFLEGARTRSYDSYCRLRNALVSPPPELQEILLVTIDEESQRELGKKWPWDRSVLAEFLNRLAMHGPKLVLFDLVLSGTSEPVHDEALAAAIQEGPPLLLACYLDRYGDPVFPLSLFTEAGGRVGLINKPRDVDLTVRKLFAGIRIPMHQQPIYAVEVQAAALVRGVPLDSLRLTLRDLTLGNARVPLEIPSALSINYWVKMKEMHSIPFWKVIRGSLDPSRVRDKMVLLGSASEITHDVYPTPLGLMPGVAISANGIMTLLSGRLIHPLPLPLVLLLGILLVTSILLVTYGMPPWGGFLAAVALTFAGVLVGFIGLAAFGYRAEYISVLILGASAWLGGIFYKYLLLLSEAMRLQRQVITDPASGLATSRYFRLRLETTRKGTARPMSLLAVQMDPPAELLQHLEWPEVQKRLQALGELLQRLKPRDGLAGRLSEDRFAVLLPGMTLEQARAWGGRLQQELGAAASGPVSLGLACTQQEGIHGASLLVRAAEAAAARARVRAKDRSLLEIFNPHQDKPIPGQPEPSQAPGLSDLGVVAGEIEERGRALERALADLRKAHRQMEENFLEVTKAFVLALESKDEYTAGHLERVSRYSTRLAEVLGLPREEIEAIREAALLHDIGKIGLPDETLHKVGPLTEEDKGILKQHLHMGARILEPMKFFKPITALIVHHHERYDGKGYPHGLTGEFIPAGAQVIAIADAFDAMTTHRGYNEPRTTQEALAEIRRGSGTQFNPTYVDEFVQLIEREGVQLAGHQSL